MTEMKRLLRITSHVGLSRYYASDADNDPVGFIPRTTIPSPYASGPTHTVYEDRKRGRVIVVETSHKRYDVFSIGDAQVYATDAEAEAVYIAGLRAAREESGS